jgi:hypothetical protein
MYIRIYTYNIHIHTHTCTYIHTYIYIYIYIFTFFSIHSEFLNLTRCLSYAKYEYIIIHTYIYKYMYIYTYMYIYMYTYIYIYIYISFHRELFNLTRSLSIDRRSELYNRFLQKLGPQFYTSMQHILSFECVSTSIERILIAETLACVAIISPASLRSLNLSS